MTFATIHTVCPGLEPASRIRIIHPEFSENGDEDVPDLPSDSESVADDEMDCNIDLCIRLSTFQTG